MKNIGSKSHASLVVIGLTSLVAAAAVLLTQSTAMATPAQQKYYKAAFGEKPKCTTCHKDDKPKKPKGKHDFNDYGTKVANAAKKPNKATYTQVGPAPKQ